jgi:hypothetical protein
MRIKKLTTILFFLICGLAGILYAQEIATVTFTSDRANARIALANPARAELFKLVPGETLEIAAEGEWSAQVLSGDTRLTILFTVQPGESAEIVASFTYGYILNTKDIDPRTKSVREDLASIVESAGTELDVFKTTIDVFPEIPVDLSELEGWIDQLRRLSLEADEILMYGMVAARRAEAEVIERLFKQEIVELRDTFARETGDLLLDRALSVFEESSGTYRFAEGRSQLEQLLRTAQDNGDPITGNEITDLMERLDRERTDYYDSINDTLRNVETALREQKPDYTRLETILDSQEQALQETDTSFDDLQAYLADLRGSLESSRRDSRKLKPHQVVRVVAWTSAAGTISFSTAAMAVGIAALVMRQGQVDRFNTAYDRYNTATTQGELDLYRGTMQDSVTTGNTWFYVAVSLIPVSVVLGLTGTFLFFVDYIYRTVKGTGASAKVLPTLDVTGGECRLGMVIRL